jgi:hypothetical protein
VPGVRHLGTLIAAAVIAPLAWILLAFGQDRSAEAFAEAQRLGAFHTADFVRPLEFLAAAGLLLGLLATLRFSPVGTLATGVVYVSSYTLLLVVPNGLLDLFGHRLLVAGRPVDPTTPVRTGTTLVLGTLLLVAGAIVGRWRRRSPRPAVDTFAGARVEDRPVGADGLGFDPPSRDADELTAARFSELPEPSMISRSRGAHRPYDYDEEFQF